MTRIAPATIALALFLGSPVFAAPAQLAPDQTPPSALAWRGVERWRLALEDEAGLLSLGFTQTPAGDYLVGGSLRLDDAELGVTGTGRWRGGRLILDLTILGGVSGVAPDAGKRRLYPDGKAPTTIDSTGFAMLHAELDGPTLSGSTAQYQTNIVTGDRLQGPVLRVGRLEHEAAAQ